MSRFEYECALTGVVEPGGVESDSDKLGDLPVGWTKVQLTRRQYNPKWVLIQQVKAAMNEALLQQFPPSMHDVQRYAIDVQVEAQFHSLEKDTPMYVSDVDDVVYISDSGDIADTLNEVRDMLGLEALTPDDDEEEDDEEDEAEEAEGDENLPHDGEVGDTQPGAK
jgi:hypothetical protein